VVRQAACLISLATMSIEVLVRKLFLDKELHAAAACCCCCCCMLLLCRLVEGPSSHQACHPTVKAAVCWRYCQLLTALPNREAEAASWGLAARKLWECAGQGFAGAQLQDVLGDEVALKGQGQHGRGAVVSLLARRLLPVYK